MEPRQMKAEELKEAFTEPAFLLMKHSLVCPISDRAFKQYERFLAERGDVITGWIDVIGQRQVSREIERQTGVKHESPQALLLADGRVVQAATHGGITSAWLATRWDELTEPQSGS